MLSLRRIATLVLLAMTVNVVQAAPLSEALSPDLAPLIDRAFSDPNRFAVEIPHVVGLATHGEWSTAGNRSVWRYTMRISTAVSMSFHAAPIYLPRSAQLRVTAGGSRYVYTAGDVNRGQLWSRIARGDTLALEIDVATADLSQLRFAITGFQAGYRGLGQGVPNHPHYDKLQSGTSAAPTTGSCQENWSCHTDTVNSGPGQGTVALVIANTGQCSGVLLNDVPGDGTPYVLTARHCENGNPNGGDPIAAAAISVYWDAVVACGEPLGTIYDPGIRTQYGATTVVEQQDAWLVQLDSFPVVSDAYYAGWDATGGAFIGGFTAHHALGTSRQFIGWYGQAFYSVVPASALGVGFTSTFWDTVNAVGSAGGGASGSGLFDANGRLTGTIVRGKAQAGGSDAGVCPVSSPSAPSAQSATQSATALSGIFSSTEDPISTTGQITIQSVLDPGHTGTLVLDGQPIPPMVSLSSNAASDSTGNLIFLQWTAVRATSCTASGGDPGDGWSGAVSTNGSVGLTSVDGGTITYTLTCTNGSKTVVAQTQVNWTLSPPAINLSTSDIEPLYGTSFQLSWRANVGGCTASGGTPGDGWSGTLNFQGTATVTESTVGTITYTLTCGSGSRMTSTQTTVTVLAPSTQVVADAATLQPGQSVQITASTRGLPCVSSGGSATDGWPTNTTYNTPVTVTESVAGTYTYTVTCGSGGSTSTSQATVVFAAGPASVTLTPATASIVSNGSVTLNWDANVRPCSLSETGPQNGAAIAEPPHNSIPVGAFVLGIYTYTLTCGSGTNSASAASIVTVTGTPRLQAFEGPITPIANQSFLVQYQSDLAPCTLSGGAAGDGWAGTSPNPNDNVYVVETAGGSYTYNVTCGTGAQSLSSQVTVSVAAAAPMVTVSASRSAAALGQPVTISWSSNVSPCQATGGVTGDGWGGAIASSGSQTVTEAASNSDSYGVSCGVNPLNASSYVSVNFVVLGPPYFQASPTSAQVGQSISLTWSSVDGSSCVLSGGSATDGWAGNAAASGSAQVNESVAGAYTYTVTCGTAPAATLMITFAAIPSVPSPPPPPTVQLTASTSEATAGNPVTLSWSTANVDSCTAGGGDSTVGWSGAVSSTGGSQTVTETTAGSYAYSITCAATGQMANVSSSTTVTVTAMPTVVVSGGGSTGGKSGGGGAVTWLELLFFGTAIAARRLRSRHATALASHSCTN
ncbi:MAG: hypothetical protein WA825_14375 [Steroidobacteraceae bacterium]